MRRGRSEGAVGGGSEAEGVRHWHVSRAHGDRARRGDLSLPLEVVDLVLLEETYGEGGARSSRFPTEADDVPRGGTLNAASQTRHLSAQAAGRE